MDLFDVVRACFRRWYIVAPLIVISVWYGFNIYTSVKPVYYSSSIVGLAPPNTRSWQSPDGAPVQINGLLEGGGPALVANLAVLGLRDPEVVSQIVQSGGSANFSAKIFPVPPNTPSLPIIMIEATGKDPAMTSKTINLAVTQVEPVLVSIQRKAGVPADQMVKALPTGPAGQPQAATPSRTRSTVATVGAGLGLSVLTGVATDFFLTRRKRRPQGGSDGKVGEQIRNSDSERQTALHAR